MKKRIVTVFLSALLVCTQAVPAFAVTMDELTSQRAVTQQKLSEVQEYIRSLEEQKGQILDQIDVIDANLVTSIAAIETLDCQITDKEVEIQNTTKDLGDAEKRKDDCYEAMKKRIQYIYEKGGTNGWGMAILSKDSFAKVVNQASFTQDMYDYDRKCLDEYSEAIAEVKELKEEQETQEAEYKTMKKEQETEKKTLEGLRAEAEKISDDYETEIANAEAVAADYQAVIAEQNAAIQELEEMQAWIAEQERINAENEQRNAEYNAEYNETNDYDEEADYDEENKYYGEDEYYEEVNDAEDYSGSEGNYEESEAEDTYYNNEDADMEDVSVEVETETYTEPEVQITSTSSKKTQTATTTKSSSSTSGQDVVDYAMQFVGNPYVWGGNSLTDGVDCSGFVNQIYKHFGYDVARQSSELRSSGYAVSYADAQPGDIICYSGHVGIYMGDGQIVHASDPTRGIISGTNASYNDILAVRRVV